MLDEYLRRMVERIYDHDTYIAPGLGVQGMTLNAAACQILGEVVPTEEAAIALWDEIQQRGWPLPEDAEGCFDARSTAMERLQVWVTWTTEAYLLKRSPELDHLNDLRGAMDALMNEVGYNDAEPLVQGLRDSNLKWPQNP